MPEILRYTRGDELESLALTWPKNDGTLWNFSTGWTFRARIGTGSGFLVEKTTGFTGAATAPNLSINFTAGELDGVGSGTYHLDVQATLTATTQTITRTWMFQVLAGVGTDTLPQSPTSLAVLGDLSIGPAVISGGTAAGGVVNAHSIQIPWDYTQDTDPTDTAVGTATLVSVDVDLTGTGGGGFGPNFHTGDTPSFGARAVYQLEGTVKYHSNLSTLAAGVLGYSDVLTIANDPGGSRSLSQAWSFQASRGIVADGGTVTLVGNDTAPGGAGFVDAPVITSLDGGTINGTTNDYWLISYVTQPAIGGNTSLEKRVGMFIDACLANPLAGQAHWSGLGTMDANSVSITEEVGIFIEKFTIGTTKTGVDSAHVISALTGGTTAAITNTSTAAVVGLTVGGRVGAGSTFTLNDAGGGFRTGNNWVGIEMAPTIVYDQDGGVLGSFAAWSAAPTIKNAATEARTVPLTATYGVRPTFQGDGALLTVASYISLEESLVLNRINSGTVSVTAADTLRSSATVDTGGTLVTRRGFVFNDATGAGSVTNQIAHDIPVLTKGTALNIGIRNASTHVATPSVQTLTAVGNTITPNATVKRLDNTSGGSLTLTSNPHISDGQDGQILVLFNSSANDVVLTDGNGVQLGAATRTIGQRDTLMLLYSTTIGDWIELAFNGAN